MTEDDYISVIDVAKQVGKVKQTVFKVLKRLDIESQKMRGPDSRGQLISYITQEESRLGRGEGTFVLSVLDGKVERGRSCRACAGPADWDQVPYVLQEMFHGDKNLK